MRKPLENRFSWSKSRVEVFERCLREYFWQYYGSWGGWNRHAPESTRQAYLLKKLDGRYGWSGKVVHVFIREYLLALFKGFKQPQEKVLEQARLLMRADLGYSKALGFKDGDKRRGDFFGLLEHYYGEQLADEEWRAIWSRTEQSLLGFFSSRWPKELAEFQGQLLELDEQTFDEVTYLDVILHARPDLAFAPAAGDVVICDWKTGTPDEKNDEAQIAGYVRYLEAKHKIADGPRKGVLVYLREGIEREVPVGATAMQAFDTKYQASIRAMQEYVEPTTNAPRSIEAFAQTDDLEKCKHCRFRRLCPGREA